MGFSILHGVVLVKKNSTTLDFFLRFSFNLFTLYLPVFSHVSDSICLLLPLTLLSFCVSDGYQLINYEGYSKNLKFFRRVAGSIKTVFVNCQRKNCFCSLYIRSVAK